MSEPIEPVNGRPTQIGDYVIHRLVGEGGMARVYAGEELLSHRKVAIKILRTELTHADEVRRRFLAEMAILANLDHPNIVRCLSCTQFEGRPVMVLELLEGWTLRELLAAKRALGWQEMVDYAVQIAKALDAAHSRTPAIVHRDLKPENVIVLRDGSVKVMDFGIAKIVQGAAAASSHAVGTLQYMSPEHIDARPIDGRADLFSLGLLMWEMLAGRPPFEGSSPRALLEKVCSEPTPSLPEHVRADLPPHVEALIDRLLAKHPDDRPASAAEVVTALEPWKQPTPLRQTVTEIQPAANIDKSPDTVEVVEGEARRSIGRQVEEHAAALADEINRFADATSAAIVRVLVALLVLPAAAVGFVGGPLAIAFLGLSVLEADGVDVEHFDLPEWVTPGLMLLAGVLATVVFIRACWAHRREPGSNHFRNPWFVLGTLLLGSWIVTTAIELTPGSKLYAPLHVFCIASGFLWLVLTASWATGRITSRLFRRLERPVARD